MPQNEHSTGWRLTPESNLNFPSLGVFFWGTDSTQSASLRGQRATDEQGPSEHTGLPLCVSVPSLSPWPITQLFSERGLPQAWRLETEMEARLCSQKEAFGIFFHKIPSAPNRGEILSTDLTDPPPPRHGVIMRDGHRAWFDFSELAFRKAHVLLFP